MREAIDGFLTTCRRPAILENGEPILPLITGQFGLEDRNGRLWIEVWTETRTFSRRILSVEKQKTGVLECSIQRLGGKSTISFLDLDRPQTAHKAVSGSRRNFCEQFRRMLTRQFPGWEITALSSSLDLRRSFSSVFPRACLVRSGQQIAALACPSRADEAIFLSFALVWFHHIRSRARLGSRTALALFLPEDAGNLTAHRVRWLNADHEITMFRFNQHGSAGLVDPKDLGNLETRVQKSALTDASSRLDMPASAPGASEAAFEIAVRQNIQLVDAALLPRPVHSQVLAFAAGDRDLIDLVAGEPAGRLAVLELKVSEDIHLPVQALDYWMRVKWHAERGELQHLFPSVRLASVAPKLFLIAPATAFHSTCATVLRYFSSEIEVERVGINSEWHDRFRVVLRLAGGDDPISHRSF